MVSVLPLEVLEFVAFSLSSGGKKKESILVLNCLVLEVTRDLCSHFFWRELDVRLQPNYAAE